MNNELKNKLIDFDLKTDKLWDLMDQIQFDHIDSFNELTFKDELVKSFNQIKNALALSIPKEVYGISKKESVDEKSNNNVIDTTSYTHIF